MKAWFIWLLVQAN